MARTYDRIRVLLEESRKNGADRGISELAAHLAERRLSVFLLDSENRRFLSRGSIARLLELVRDLSLVNATDSAVKLTARGRNALKGENYNPTISIAVLDYLSGRGIKLSSIHSAINLVRRPDFAGPDKIFEKLSAPRKEEVGKKRFRTLLYLLFCTEKIDRQVKVIYGKRSRGKT